MLVKINFLAVNPFFEAYFESDLLGKLIFIALFALSMITWIILIQKSWSTYHAKKDSYNFLEAVKNHKGNFLALEYPFDNSPFSNIYLTLKKQTVELLNKNRRFAEKEYGEEGLSKGSYLFGADIDIVQTHLMTTIASEVKEMQKNLYILSTIYPLAPFLGLLGTVWGILTTFTHLQAQSGGNTNQLVIGGLSLALATTVIGLVDAIPALIGYNYIKNNIDDFQTEMEIFSTEILTSVEIQYRKIDLGE